MSIQATCGECGREYSLKDEFAGKRFKCKACQALVQVPAADDDFLEDEGFEEPRPQPRKSSKGKKSKSSKRKGAKKPFPVLLIVMPIVAVVVGGLALWLLKGGLAQVQNAGKEMVAAINAPGEWVEFTTPDGVLTVSTPKRLSSMPIGELVLPAGGEAWGATSAGQSYVVVVQKASELPPLVLPDGQELTAQPARYLQGRHGEPGSMRRLVDQTGGGRTTLWQFRRKDVEPRVLCKAFENMDYVYCLNFYGEGADEEENFVKFFNSIQLHISEPDPTQ